MVCKLAFNPLATPAFLAGINQLLVDCVQRLCNALAMSFTEVMLCHRISLIQETRPWRILVCDTHAMTAGMS